MELSPSREGASCAATEELHGILSLWGASCCVMYTEESFRYKPAIATKSLIGVIIYHCIATCFGPYGPSSGEYNILPCLLTSPKRNELYTYTQNLRKIFDTDTC
jgi:hypothetical protein